MSERSKKVFIHSKENASSSLIRREHSIGVNKFCSYCAAHHIMIHTCIFVSCRHTMVAPVVLTNSLTESWRAPSFKPLMLQLSICQFNCAIKKPMDPYIRLNCGGRQVGSHLGCGTGNKHKDNHTETHGHESSKLKSPIHLKASGCRRSDTKQESVAHRVGAAANYEMKGPCSVVGR